MVKVSYLLFVVYFVCFVKGSHKSKVDDSIVAWTSFNEENETASVKSIEANRLTVQYREGNSENVAMKTVFKSDRSPSRYWDITSDFNEKKIFVADFKQDSYIGVHDLTTNTTTTHFEGKVGGLEAFAFDWITRNLFWADLYKQWIMVSNLNFTYSTPIYKTEDEPYALCLHARKRILFLALFKDYDDKIVRMDMSGNNEKVLFSYPEVSNVEGMTVDYFDQKLYWTNFSPYEGSKIMSSNFDGTYKKTHFHQRTSLFYGVATYLNYIYVVDVRKRVSDSGDDEYYLWWASKNNRYDYGKYRLKEKSNSVTVYGWTENYNFQTRKDIGSCSTSPPCDHLCLPMEGEKRKCVCSTGYKLVGETQCKKV